MIKIFNNKSWIWLEYGLKIFYVYSKYMFNNLKTYIYIILCLLNFNML
jgi:hypothetical protein